MKRLFFLAAVFGAALSLWVTSAPAQTLPPGGVQTSGLARTSDLATQGRMDLYVCEGASCSDTNDCSFTRQCRTPSAACARVPPNVNHEVHVWVDAGTYSTGICNVIGRNFGGTDFNTKGRLHFHGRFLPASLDGGTNSGTATSVTAGSGSTWAVINDTGQSWVPSAMSDGGYWVQITGGSGSDGGWMLPIIGNTTTALSVPGQFYTAPAASSTYQIVEIGTKVNGRLPVSGITPGIGPASLSPGVSRPADLIAFNNSVPGEVVGSPPTPAPITVQGFWFVSDGGTAGVATVLADSTPISLEENRWSDFGTGHRVFGPLADDGYLGVRRSHIDTGGRITTFNDTGVQMGKLFFDQNDVQGAGGVFSLDLLREFQSRNNLVRGPKSGTGSYLRTSTCTTCSIAGDRFAVGASGNLQTILLEMNRGNLYGAGNGMLGNVTIDGVSAPGVGGSIGWIATAGKGLQVQIDHGAGIAAGFGASAITVLDSQRAITASFGSQVTWKHGTTSWTMAGTELDNSILMDGVLGGKLSVLEASSSGLFSTPDFGTVVGWGEGVHDIYGSTANSAPGAHVGPLFATEVHSEGPVNASGVDAGWLQVSGTCQVTGPATFGSAVSAPLFDGGSLAMSGTGAFGGAVSAPLFDGGSAALAGTLGVAGQAVFASTVSAQGFDGGIGVFSAVSVTTSIMAGADVTAGGAMVSTTANGGFQSAGLNSALVRGFPASGVGVRLNAGTALGATAGDALTAFENAAVQKALVLPSGAYVVVGGLPRRVGSYFPIETTSTAFTAVGLPSPTLLAGTPTASNADTTYQAIQFETGASNGNASGYAGPFTTTRITQLPGVYNVVRTDASAVTSTYLAFGTSAAALEGLTTLAGANGIRGCWFRYDTGLSDTTWQAVSSDGTTASATDTTVSVAAATTYTLLVDASLAPGTCRFYVNGVLRVAKQINIPTGSTALGLQGSVTTRTNAARTVTIARTALEQL